MDEETRKKFNSDLYYLSKFEANNEEILQKFKIAGIKSNHPRSSRLLVIFETCIKTIQQVSEIISNTLENISLNDEVLYDYAIDLNSYVKHLRNSFVITSPNYDDLETSESWLLNICQVFEKINNVLKLYYNVDYTYNAVQSNVTLKNYAAKGTLINSDPEYYRTPIGELEQLIIGKKDAIKTYFGPKLIKHQNDDFKTIFYALVAPSMTGKTQAAFTFKILKPLYFLLDSHINDSSLSDRNIQDIYKNFIPLSRLFRQFAIKDLELIKDLNFAEGKTSNIYNHISARSLDENYINTKFKTLGLVSALVEHANSNFDPSNSTWMEYFATSSRSFTVKAMSLYEFRNYDIGNYVLFFDEFDSSDESAFVRNLFRAAFTTVLVANTNAKAANLVGKVSSGHSRVGDEFSWSIVAIRLNCINNYVLNIMYPELERKFIEFASRANDTNERRLIFEFLRNFLFEQLEHLRPGFAQLIIGKIVEIFDLNLSVFTLNHLLQIIVNELVTEMKSKKPELIRKPEGIMGSLALFMNNAYIPADISSEDLGIKLLHMKSYIRYHFYYLINPVDITKWCFIACRPESIENQPSIKPLTIFNYDWKTQTKDWAVEYTYFMTEEIIPFLAVHSIPKGISIPSTFKNGLIQADTDPNTTGNTSNSSQVKSLSGNLLEVISAVSIIEASQHFVGSATPTFYGQDGKSFLTNLIENLIETAGFRGNNKVELNYDLIKEELNCIHVPYLFPAGMKLPPFFKQNFYNCEGFNSRSVNFGEFRRTKDSTQIDGIFNFFRKTATRAVPLDGVCAVECKNWRINLLAGELLPILEKAVKNSAHLSLIICNSLGTSKDHNLNLLIEYCQKQKIVVLKLKETQTSKEFELEHYCRYLPSELSLICIIIELFVIDPKCKKY